MIAVKFHLFLFLRFAPFTTSIILYGKTIEKGQHMLPGQIINVTSKCLDKAENVDNPYRPPRLIVNLPNDSNCFKAYETNVCNQNSTEHMGAYLEYSNVSRPFTLKLKENEDKLQNFNFDPKSFQTCLSNGNEETKLEEDDTCELSINFKMKYKTETRQEPMNLGTQIKSDGCLDNPFNLTTFHQNKDSVGFQINLIRNNKTQEDAIICLELFTQNNCQGNAIRMIIPQQSHLFNDIDNHESAKIWEYFKETGDHNEIIRSIRRCSHCLGRNLSEINSTPTKIISKSLVLTVSGISASLVFAILVMLLVFLVLRMRKKRRMRAYGQTFSFKRLQDQHSFNNQSSVSGQNVSTRRAVGLKELCEIFSESFEIPRTDINIGDVNGNKEISMIGAGEYTVLYKGRYGLDGRVVAIKTIKNGHGNDMVMRNALEECQILMYLGKHPGIVEFLGVCTQNLSNGELFIVIQWCEEGTLKGYLSQNKGQFISMVKDGEWVNKTENELDLNCQVAHHGNSNQIKFSTVHLFKWCCEVAEAMEFISSKNIVHVSLSAKNVLLDENLSCKISDFRSAKMPAEWSDSSNPFSMKRRQVPWRWYAIESLMDEVFTQQTDIWTFGIFMWEIFSLGTTPYPDYIFGPEFLLCIKHGYRLLIPNEATVEIYQLMLTCWYDDPEKRPSFSKIRQKLSAMRVPVQLQQTFDIGKPELV